MAGILASIKFIPLAFLHLDSDRDLNNDKGQRQRLRPRNKKRTMLTTTTLFTTFAMAGVLVGAATTQTVSSSSGVNYNCPNVEPMEVAYAESCTSF